MTPRDRAAARGMRIVPVLHIVLFGHAARAGIADVIVAQEILDLGRRVLVDKEPAPHLGLVRALRMPRRHRARLARQQRSVREDLSGRSQETRLIAEPPAPLLPATAEVFGDER